MNRVFFKIGFAQFRECCYFAAIHIQIQFGIMKSVTLLPLLFWASFSALGQKAASEKFKVYYRILRAIDLAKYKTFNVIVDDANEVLTEPAFTKEKITAYCKKNITDLQVQPGGDITVKIEFAKNGQKFGLAKYDAVKEPSLGINTAIQYNLSTPIHYEVIDKADNILLSSDYRLTLSSAYKTAPLAVCHYVYPFSATNF